MKLNKTLLLLILITVVVSIGPAPRFAVASEDFLRWQQQDKESLFKEFNEKKRADPKDAYRVAKIYLEKFGKEADDNTKYVKEWVVAYEAVMSRAVAIDANAGNGALSKPDSTAPSSARISDINGTTWQMKGEQNGNAWAEIFVFKPGGRFQYEKYGADGSANVRAGTWRQLDKSIFAVLLGPDGNTAATVRAELKGTCMRAMLVFQGQPEWRFLMETDAAPNACKDEREAELRYESDPANARKLLRELVNSVGKTTARFKNSDLSWTFHTLVNIPEFDGCVITLQIEIDTDTPDYKNTSSKKMTIPLSDIDPDSIKVDFNNDDNNGFVGYRIIFSTKNKVKTILTTESSKSTDELYKQEGMSFDLGDQEKANRAAKAFSQIVKACQQK